MQVKHRAKQLVMPLLVVIVLSCIVYGTHWATVAYAESRDQKTIATLQEQVKSNTGNVKAQVAKVSKTLQYLNENNIEFTTEADGETLVIKIVRDRAKHYIKDGVDTFVLSDTTNDPMIKEK